MALNVACAQLTTAERIEQLCTECDVAQFVDVYGSDALDEIIDAASDMVANSTGRVVTGRCTVTVRPCSDGVCGCWGLRCTCCNIDGVRLFGVRPAVTQVKIDGAVEAAELYKLVDGRDLVRTDGGTWPGLQNVAKADTEENTFSITFTHGDDGGWAGMMAATEMACDLMKASSPGGRPQLPASVINALMDGTNVSFDIEASQLAGFPWMQRLMGAYPLGDRPVIWSPEIRGQYTLHRVS